MGLKNLSIIQYQNINENPYIHRLWLPVTAFYKQIDYFYNNDFDVIHLDKAMEFMRKKVSSNHLRPISLTFDNGFRGFYNLFFKDRKNWVYIRKYGLDKVAHWISEKFDNKR
jgi:peptidoglycan/xylan/chitin deacetylase (PgdA/CDA1 family)